MATNDVMQLDSIAASDATDIVAVCTVDATHVLAVFGSGSSIYKKVQVFEVDSFDGSFTAIGTALTVASSSFAINSRSRIVMLDSTTAAIVYATGSTSQSIRTLSIDLSTYAVTTKGTAYTGMFGYGGFANLYAISSTRLLHVGNDTSSDGWVTMLAVDASTGGISSLSSAIEFEPSSITAVDLLLISSSHFVIGWAGVGNDGFVQTFSFDSTSMTAMDSPLEYDTSEGRDISIGKMDASTGLGIRYCLFRRAFGNGQMKGYYSDSPSGAVIRLAISGPDSYGSDDAENNASQWIEDDDIFLVWSESTTDYAQVMTWSSPNMVAVGVAESFSPSYSAGNSQLAKLANDLYVWAHGDLYSLAVERPGGVVTLSLSETVEVDSAARKLPSRRLTETVKATDSVRARISAKVLTETVKATDSVLRVIGRSFQETVHVAASFASAFIYLKTLTETVVVDATSYTQAAFGRVLTETVNVIDIKYTQLARFLTETVEVSDSVIARISGKVFQEIVHVSDSVSKQGSKIFTETIEVTDSIIRSVGKVFTETVEIIDYVFKTFNLFFTEVVSVATTIIRSPGKYLRETVNVSNPAIAFYKWARGLILGRNNNTGISYGTRIKPQEGRNTNSGIGIGTSIRDRK